MKNTCPIALSSLALMLMTCGSSPAQSSEITRIFKGEIHSDSLDYYQGYTVHLEDLQHRGEIETAPVQQGGEFEFHGTLTGEYRVAVTDPRGEVLRQDVVQMGLNRGPLVLELSGSKIDRPPSGGVSLNELQHPPSKRAFQAFVKAQKYSAAGEFAKAAEQLEKAVAISPYYATAYTNLAAQHIRMGRYEEAVEEARHAMEIAKPDALNLSNIAYAFVMLRRYDEAVESARRALQLDPQYARAHYALGIALLRDRRTLPEGMRHLETAAQSFPSAKVALQTAQLALQQQSK